LKIQHWFFNKLRRTTVPRSVLKANPILKKPSTRKSIGPRIRGKENEGRLQQNIQAGNEQAIIDACWSVNMLGDKVRNQMLQRINRINKIRTSQLSTGRAKTPNRTGPRRKLKNDSALSKVIIIKEDKSPDHFTNMNLTDSVKLSPTKPINSFATSVFSESNTMYKESFNSSEVAAFQSVIEATQSSVNKVLKEQITKCTEDKLKRKRRGRKERGKLEDINNVTVSIPNERILEEECKLNESTFTNVSNNTETNRKRSKSGVRKPNTFKKSFISSMKVVEKSSKRKDINPKRYIARKYLSELYNKVIFHVREIEKERKYLATQQNMKTSLRFKHILKKNSNIIC